jgi:hypothetical protein
MLNFEPGTWNLEFSKRGAPMPKKAIWLVIIFTLLFILGINTGDLDYLMHLGNTICLSCIGVG